MAKLFQRSNESPIQFYLVDLPEKPLKKYKYLIQNNGGAVAVEPIAKKNIFTFTLPSHAYDYKIVFDVQFIDDCVKQDKILDISDYFIGDSRLNLGCEFSRMFCGIKSCLLDQIPSSTVPESQKGTSESPFHFSSVYSRRKSIVHVKYNEDSDIKEEMMDIDQNVPLQIVESRLSDSFMEDEHITQTAHNNTNKIPATLKENEPIVSKPQRKTSDYSSISVNLKSQGSALKSKSPSPKLKKSNFEGNKLTISKTQVKSVVFLPEANESKSRNTKSLASSTNSDSETPEPLISNSTLQSLKSEPMKQERSNTDSEISDDEIQSSLSSSMTSVVESKPSISKSEIQNSKCESISTSPSKIESFNSKLTQEAVVVLTKLDELQLIKSNFPSSLKSEPLVSKAESETSEIYSELGSIESCISEYDSIDSDSEREDSNSKPSISKPKIKPLGKYSYEKISSEELKKWAKEVTKGREKDEFGHPIGKSRSFQTWERQIMVDFLIKAGKIDIAAGPNAWQLAYDLKILPKRRTYASLVREFGGYIQPNIEEFNLPPHIEAQFIKRRGKIEKPSEKLKAWAMEISKMSVKDDLSKEGTPISTWEKRMMIDFLITSEKIDKANKEKTWELAYHLKIFPKHKTKSALRMDFCRKILPTIESFDLPKNIEAQFLKLRTASKESLEETSDELKEWAKELMKNLKKDGIYSRTSVSLEAWEKKAMVEYLIRTKKIENARSYNTWQLACDLKIVSSCRTSDILSKKFISTILPRIEEFNLAPEIEAQFVQLRKVKSSANLEPSEEVKTWASEISKNRKKDQFGYPKGSIIRPEPYQPWENKVMLDFVIKMERIDLAKAPNFWAIACDLKILPKIRTKFALAKIFREKILSNIESYNLQPEIEAKFIKLRTAADMKYITRKNRPNAIAISISS